MEELIASELLEKLGRDLSSKNSEKSLRNELDLLNRSIEEKDRKLQQQGSSKVWVKRMREISERIEDVIDECYAFPVGSFAFVNYLSRAGGFDRWSRRRSFQHKNDQGLVAPHQGNTEEPSFRAAYVPSTD